MNNPDLTSVENKNSKLALDFLWNLSAGAWGVLLALLATPYVVHRMGAEDYGVYALLGILLSYLAFTEIGLGRAVERHGATALGKGEKTRLRAYFSAALTLQSIIAIVVSFGIALTGTLALNLFEIAPSQREPAETAMSIVAISFGINLLLGTAQAPLRAHRAFSTLNRISLVAQTVTTMLIVGAAWWDPTVVSLIIALTLASALRLLLVLVASCQRVGIPHLSFDQEILRDLLSFGGALTLSSLLAPILSHMEKLLLSALVGTTALAYYVVPFRVLARFGLVAGSLSSALFPMLSRLEGEGRQNSMWSTNVRATQLLFWLLLPIFSLLWIAGDVLLELWMGRDFAQRAAGILPWLVAGTFVNLLGWNAVGLIQTRGRPGLVAIAYAIEIVIYLPLAWFLMHRFGIVGAATAWGFRILLDTSLLWWVAGNLFRRHRRLDQEASGLFSWAMPSAGLLLVASTGLKLLLPSGWPTLLLGCVTASATLAIAWLGGLAEKERQAAMAIIHRYFDPAIV